MLVWRALRRERIRRSVTRARLNDVGVQPRGEITEPQPRRSSPRRVAVHGNVAHGSDSATVRVSGCGAARHMHVYGIVGRKNSGKTHLVTRLVSAATRRGLVVSTVKHAHHTLDVDQPGKDSWLHREAGAREVIVASASRWALLHELRGAPEPTLDELLSRLGACDLVLVEGFKRGDHPKLEVYRAGCGQPPLGADDATVEAIALDAATTVDTTLARLPLDDAEA